MSLEKIINLEVTLIAIPFFFLAILLEILAIKFLKTNGTIDTKDNSVSIFMGLTSVITNGLSAFITLNVLFWFEQFQITKFPLTIWTVIICFILDDLRYYTHHRIVHRCRWGWAMHVTHHSSNRISLAVALRQGWTKHFTGTMYLKIPLILIGFDPVLVIFCGAMNAIYQFFIHTETVRKLPNWVEAIFNTPSHHRVHHGKNPKFLDKNYAGTLIIWDKLFNTFAEEDKDQFPDYGLVKDLETFNPIKIAFHEYWNILKDMLRTDISIKQKFFYLFAPPGWSHDGSRKMSTDIKKEFKSN